MAFYSSAASKTDGKAGKSSKYYDDLDVRNYILGLVDGSIIPNSSDLLFQGFLEKLKISCFSDWEYYFTDKQGQIFESGTIQCICELFYDRVTDGQNLLKLFRLETLLFVSELWKISEDRIFLSKYADNAVKICKKIEGDAVLSIQAGQYILLCMACIRGLFAYAFRGIEQESNRFFYNLMDDLAKLIMSVDCQEFDINPYILANEEWYNWEKSSNGMSYTDYLSNCLAVRKKYRTGIQILRVNDSSFRCFIHDVNCSRRAYQTDAAFGVINNTLKIAVKEEIYEFFKLTDRFDYEQGNNDEEELNEFIFAVLDTADEETLMLLVSKCFLQRERVDEYIDYLLDSGNTFLVPYLISLMEEEDE